MECLLQGHSNDRLLCFNVTQISHSLSEPPQHTHRHTHTPPTLSNPFVVGVQRLFETFYMCGTRLLCLPLSYFPDTHRHFYTHKDKDKGRGIITCEHKPVWWHPYAIPSHPKSYLCLPFSWSLHLHTVLIYIFISNSLFGKVKMKLLFIQHPQIEKQNQEVCAECQ